MENLELKHLAPYLPYNLKCQYSCIIDVDNNHTSEMTENNIHRALNGYGTYDIKPILRPLSDLNKSEFVMEDWRKKAILFLDETANLPFNSRNNHVGTIMYGDITKLFEWHFDVFGLITQGLAIDINRLNE
jgi:hypothetical protein